MLTLALWTQVKGGRRGGKLDTVASEGGYVTEQDRSLTVMIPRAKYRPVQASTSVLSMSTFSPGATAAAAAAGTSTVPSEHKLLSYLEAGASVSVLSLKSNNYCKDKKRGSRQNFDSSK